MHTWLSMTLWQPIMNFSVRYHRWLLIFKVLSFIFIGLTMLCLGIISFSFLLRILNFLVLCIDVFHQFWKIPRHYLFKYFFLHHCLSLLLLELQLQCPTGLTWADLINIFFGILIAFVLQLGYSYWLLLAFPYPFPAMSISTVKQIE